MSTREWSNASRVAALLVIGVAIVLLLLSAMTPSQMSAMGQTVTAVVRGGWSAWSQFDHLDTWFEETVYVVEVQNRDPEEESGPLARFSIHGGAGLCDEYDCDSWPVGTVTETLQVDSRPAVKYTVPTYSLADGLAGEQYVDIEDSSRPTYFVMVVRGAEDEQEYNALMGDLDAIVDTYVFIDDYVDTSTWIETYQATPTVATLDEYEIYHPARWNVTETPSQVIAASPGPTDVVTVAFEPAHSWSEWESAKPMLGSGSIRFVSSQAVGGIRTTAYMMEHPDLPIEVTASVPDSQVGSPQYWADDQAVWAIMGNAYFAYNSAISDPYP